MSGYTKLFNSILDSTIWGESDETRIVWITLLAMCDKNGEVQSSIPGLAHRSRVDVADCIKALRVLESPDEFSRSPEFEGRRIEPIDGGWRLLNHGKYRRLLSAEERREYKARKAREYRARGQNLSTVSTNGQSRHITDTDVPDTDDQITDTKRAKAETNTPPPESVCVGEPLVSLETALSNSGMVAPQIVEQWWNSRQTVGWVNAKGQAIKVWQTDLAGFNATYLQNHADRNNGAAPKFAKQTKPAALPPEPDGWREAYQREYGHDITGDWSIQSNWQRAEILEMMNGSTQ